MTLALFDPSEVKLPVASGAGRGGKGAAIKSTAKRIKSEQAKCRLAHRTARCAEVVGNISHGETIHLVSAAEWSAHDLITHLVAQTGPVDLWFTTWSISEDGLRSLLRLRDAESLKSVNAILDWRIHIRNQAVAQLARAQVDNLKVYSCHAKIYVLKNDSWGITIVSSSNLTNNPRIEASVLTEGREVADWHIGWIKEVLDGATPFGDLS